MRGKLAEETGKSTNDGKLVWVFAILSYLFVSLVSSFGRVAMMSVWSTVSALKDMQAVQCTWSIQILWSTAGRSSIWV